MQGVGWGLVDLIKRLHGKMDFDFDIALWKFYHKWKILTADFQI